MLGKKLRNQKRAPGKILFLRVIFLTVSCFGCPLDAAAQTWYVTETGGGNKNGTSWETASSNLGDILANKVRIGDQVWVARGTYKPTLDGDRGAAFSIPGGIAVYGGFPARGGNMDQRNPEINQTILTGDLDENDDFDITQGGYLGGTGNDNTYQVVIVKELTTSSLLDGFTLTGGNADNNPTKQNRGGGIYAKDTGEFFTLKGCTVTGNYAEYGGGMFSDTSNVQIIDCAFTKNYAEYGGGMYNWRNSDPEITSCTFRENRVTKAGGGMYNMDNADPAITYCSFTANRARDEDGGGIHNCESSPEVTHCVFTSNQTGFDGGGIYNYKSSPGVINCTFADNQAGDDGGGMRNATNSNPKIVHCTFTANRASNKGAGMFNTGDTTGDSLLEITDTIVWGNTKNGGLASEIFNENNTFNPVVNYSVVRNGYAGTGNIDEDPRLGPLIDNGGPTRTCALEEGSSAIDKGNLEATVHTLMSGDFTEEEAEELLATDQRGYKRHDEQMDIGAYEKGGKAPLIITVTAGKGGRVSPKGTLRTWEGEKVTYTITPDPEHVIRDVRVDGVSRGPRETYVFENIIGTHTLEATFEVIPPSPTPTPTPTPAPTPTPTPTPTEGTVTFYPDPQKGQTLRRNDENPEVQSLLQALRNPESDLYKEYLSLLQDEHQR